MRWALSLLSGLLLTKEIDMRSLGRMSGQLPVEGLQDYLYTLGIESELSGSSSSESETAPAQSDPAQSDTEQVELWIIRDDQLAQGRAELQRFLAEPAHERYQAAGTQATALVQQAEERHRQRVKPVQMREVWQRNSAQGCPVTFGVMAVTLMVALLTELGRQPEGLLPQLMFAGPDGTPWWQSGELWRLVSPMLLHFGIWHVLFNLISFYRLAPLLENRSGSGWLLAFVLATGVAGNLAQGLAVGPSFGGLSGVNYGLFGFLWLRGKFAPEEGLGVSQDTIIWMCGWHVMCLVGIVADVANWAHWGGLVVGMLWGLAGPLWRQRRDR